MKRLGLVLLIVLSMGILVGCTSDVNEDRNAVDQENNQHDENDLREFTVEELSDYDGRDGREAYIAVDGYVYDVSNSSLWPNGLHRNQHQAGQDLTSVINSSPHGRSVLDNIPRIGRLVE